MSAHHTKSNAREVATIRCSTRLRFSSGAAFGGFTSANPATTLRRMRASIALGSLIALLGVGCYRTNERGAEPDARVAFADAGRDARVDPIGRDVGTDARVISGCRRPADCPGATCILNTAIPPADLADVPLTCAAPVGPGGVGDLCDANADCAENLCALGGGCVVPCIDASDCLAGHQCARIPIVTSASSMQFAQACTPWVSPPETATVVQNETVSAMANAQQDFTIARFDAPSRLSLFVAESDDDNRFVVSIQTAGGTPLFDVNEWGRTLQPNPAIGFFQTVSVLLPSGMRDAPRGDDYIVNLLNGNTRSYRRIAVERTSVGTRINLNFIYVGVPGGDEMIPPRFISDMILRYGEIIGMSGLSVGVVRHVNMPGALATQHSIIESQAEVADLLRLSAGTGRPVLNVFLIRSSSDFLGISGGLPGAINVHGTGNSGVVLSIEDLESIAPALEEGFAGAVMAHELGHFQGFPHTSEADGSVIDVFEDTPECLIAQDANGDGFLDPRECRGFGADHVMFWQGVSSAGIFSPRQQALLRISTALH